MLLLDDYIPKLDQTPKLHLKSWNLIEIRNDAHVRILGERLCLSARGTLGFCPANWDHSADCGDLAKSSIKEVWQGDFL